MIKKAIAENNVEAVEKILKMELAKDPSDLQLWIKLTLTELQFPFEDYASALACIKEINKVSDNNIEALILEAGIKWHNWGVIDDELFARLDKVNIKDNPQMAIIYYLQSLYYNFENDLKNEVSFLRKSIELHDKYVNPYQALGFIAQTELRYEESKEFYQKAINNVQKIYHNDELYDFTDINTYIAEYITGISMSQVNYKSLKALVL